MHGFRQSPVNGVELSFPPSFPSPSLLPPPPFSTSFLLNSTQNPIVEMFSWMTLDERQFNTRKRLPSHLFEDVSCLNLRNSLFKSCDTLEIG